MNKVNIVERLLDSLVRPDCDQVVAIFDLVKTILAAKTVPPSTSSEEKVAIEIAQFIECRYRQIDHLVDGRVVYTAKVPDVYATKMNNGTVKIGVEILFPRWSVTNLSGDPAYDTVQYNYNSGEFVLGDSACKFGKDFVMCLNSCMWVVDAPKPYDPFDL